MLGRPPPSPVVTQEPDLNVSIYTQGQAVLRGLAQSGEGF